MKLQAWSSQFETKIFTHIKKEAAAGGKKGAQKSQRRVFCLMLCGGGNCKIVKRHFPAICMAIQPESSCERRVCSQPSHSPGQKTLACGPDECMFVFVGCLYVLCLLRMHWPGVNWIMFAAQLKLQALWQQSNPCKSITARKSNVSADPRALSPSLSLSI